MFFVVVVVVLFFSCLAISCSLFVSSLTVVF